MNELQQEFDKLLYNNIQYAINNYIFYYDSIENYYSRQQPSMYRKFNYFMTFVLLAIFNVKYGLLLMYPDELMWTPMKDGTMILGDQAILFHALLFSISLVTISGKLVIVFYEAKAEFKPYDLIVAINKRDPRYTLSEEHMKKIKFITSILYYGYIRIFGSIAIFVFSFTAFSLTIVTYLYYDYGNVVVLCLWTLHLIFMISQTNIVLLMGSFLFYLPITYLNYKFDELTKKLRISIRWNNEYGFYKILAIYDHLIVVVSELSGPYNMIIGITYCFGSYLIAINMKVLKIKQHDLLNEVLRKIFLFLLIISMLNAFLINQISASITVRNKSFTKFLYPVFCWKMNRRIRMQLKIDSFIARLKSEFVGFYCFHWFKFTKMAFYQFAITISVSYFLLSKFLEV